MLTKLFLTVFLSCTQSELFKQRVENTPEIKLRSPYLLAFHQCNGQEVDCFDPTKHETRVAQSQDGTHWTFLDDIPPFKGSVPDLLFRDETLFVYALPKLRRYRLRDRKVDISHFHVSDEKDQLVLQVDPSPILDENGRIVLFFLVGIAGTDPARCPPEEQRCVKEFRSATEVENTNGLRFQLDAGIRASIEISQGHFASDPDLFKGPDGYYMYLSRGAQVQVLFSQTLRGSYKNVPGLPQGMISRNVGGVPAGYYDEDKKLFWTFITKHKGRHKTEIHMAKH
ncbi:MAG: hypothetical protein VX278_10845, partial [Myxococcota bacterium]|nr:hypothetical protein [Myxococcota bacterium]